MFAASFVLVSVSAQAAGPALKCYLTYVSTKKTEVMGEKIQVGTGFEKIEVHPDLSNTEDGLFGRSITIDLDSIKDMNTAKRIEKTFTSSDFRGEVALTISYWYQGDVAAGYSINLKHRKSPNGKVYSSAYVEGPFSSDFPVKTILDSNGRKGLESVEIECLVSK